MNMKTFKFIALMLVLAGSMASCKDKSDGTEIEIPYVECAHEGSYLNTINLEGTGLMFVDSVPVKLQNKKGIMYIIYDREQDVATFSADYTPKAQYNGNICNFPDFAKKWKISSGGKQIYYQGKLYETGVYPMGIPIIGGDMILTILK